METVKLHDWRKACDAVGVPTGSVMRKKEPTAWAMYTRSVHVRVIGLFFSGMALGQD